MSDNAASLRSLLDKHASPPPEIISTLPKGGVTLDFVGHAETTRILIEEDPDWSWEPQAWSPDGGPLVVQRGNLLVLWGWMTVLGKRLPCVGTCDAKKTEADKELIGDLIRNGAMRFGIALNLWSKAEKADEGFVSSQQMVPEPAAKPGWDEARWKALADRLRGLPEAGRNVVVARLTELGLFVERKPVTPFADADLDKIEKLIGLGSFDDRPAAGPSPAAIEIMAEALNIDDPLNPPEGVAIDDVMRDLAEVEDINGVNWKDTGAKFAQRPPQVLVKAVDIANRLNVEPPTKLTEIRGPVAVELRNEFLQLGDPFTEEN